MESGKKLDKIKKTIVNTITPSASPPYRRKFKLRELHPSYLGYIEIIPSADTGEMVGINKYLHDISDF